MRRGLLFALVAILQWEGALLCLYRLMQSGSDYGFLWVLNSALFIWLSVGSVYAWLTETEESSERQ